MTEVLAVPHTDLSDYHSWLHEMPNGDAYVIDPIDRVPLTPSYLPNIFRNDPRLMTGYRHLVTHGNTINLTIMQSQHVTAGNLDTRTRPTFEQWVQRSDVYFYEKVGWNRQDNEKKLQEYREDRPSDDNSFERRVWSAIADANTTISLSADIERTNYHADEVLWSMSERFDDGSLNQKDAIKALIVGERLREQYIPGKLGYELAAMQPDNSWFIEPAANSPINVFMTMGIAHLDFEKRFIGLKPRTVFAGMALDREKQMLNKQLMRAVKTGYIPANIGCAALK